MVSLFQHKLEGYLLGSCQLWAKSDYAGTSSLAGEGLNQSGNSGVLEENQLSWQQHHLLLHQDILALAARLLCAI